jgi:multidrug efflux system membrane fusion protein
MMLNQTKQMAHSYVSRTCRSLILIGVFSGFLISMGCSKAEKEAPAEMIRPVRFITVQTPETAASKSFPGIARAGVASRLSFRVPGTLVSVSVDVGNQIRKGQEIAAIDPTDYQLKVQQADASLAQARAQARNVVAGYTRVRGLYENRNASRNDLDAARAASESASASVSAIEQQLALAHRQLDYTRLKAPADCVVARVPVEVNEYIAPGHPVALVHCGNTIDVGVTLPGVLIRRITEGEIAQVLFDALPGKSLDAVVTEIGVSVTGMQTTFPVTVRLAVSDPAIRSGMSAEVNFQLAMTGITSGHFVPPVAVVEDRNGRFVYLVEPTDKGLGQIQRREVTVGDIGANGLEIHSGLEVGDRVVVAGVSRIRPGQVVKLSDPKGGS